MPKATHSQLFSLVTNTTPTGKRIELNDKLKTLYERDLTTNGISVPVANAMANIIGRERNAFFRLWEMKKDPAATASTKSAGYEADGVIRYFFEYGMPSGEIIVMEYSRFDKFEIRGSIAVEGVWKEMKFTDAVTCEAVAAMLFALMVSEGGQTMFPSVATSFSRAYQTGFTSGPDEGLRLILALYQELYAYVDPKNTDPAVAGFKMADSCIVKATGRLKRVLEGETVGYAKNDNLLVYLASDTAADNKYEGGSADEHPTKFVLLEGVLAVQKSVANVKLEANMYPINPERVLDEDDKALLLPIPDWYVPCPNVINIAKLVSDSANLAGRSFRNVMFRGPAGSGKTEGAKALASMFGSPYGFVTGHAETEFFDLTSSLIPNTDSQMSTDGELYDFLRHALRDSGMKLPSFLDIATMPEAVFEQITGTADESAGETECLAALVANLMKACKQDKSMFCGEAPKFKTVQSDLAMGFQKGWLVELQEMNTILKPGVLVGLNNILEYGRLRLPTGEVISRHPDTVIVFTQNVGYAGTTDGNQSVYSRIELKCDLDHPTEDEMVSRIKMHVPEINEVTCRTIVQSVIRVQQNLSAEIEGGSVGTREALNWAKATVLLGGDMRAAAELTVLPSVGEDPDDIALVRSDIFQSVAEAE